jgi:hypothetical protein
LWPNYTGRGPRNYQRTDERIHEDVCERLTDDPQVDAFDIEVRVKDGEVTLVGNVNSRQQKRRAEDVAAYLVLAGFLLPAALTRDRRTAMRRRRGTGTSARRSAPRTTRISRR